MQNINSFINKVYSFSSPAPDNQLQNTTEGPLATLPAELLECIFFHLPPEDANNLCNIKWKWKNLKIKAQSERKEHERKIKEQGFRALTIEFLSPYLNQSTLQRIKTSSNFSKCALLAILNTLPFVNLFDIVQSKRFENLISTHQGEEFSREFKEIVKEAYLKFFRSVPNVELDRIASEQAYTLIKNLLQFDAGLEMQNFLSTLQNRHLSDIKNILLDFYAPYFMSGSSSIEILNKYFYDRIRNYRIPVEVDHLERKVIERLFEKEEYQQVFDFTRRKVIIDLTSQDFDLTSRKDVYSYSTKYLPLMLAVYKSFLKHGKFDLAFRLFLQDQTSSFLQIRFSYHELNVSEIMISTFNLLNTNEDAHTLFKTILHKQEKMRCLELLEDMRLSFLTLPPSCTSAEQVAELIKTLTPPVILSSPSHSYVSQTNTATVDLIHFIMTNELVKDDQNLKQEFDEIYKSFLTIKMSFHEVEFNVESLHKELYLKIIEKILTPLCLKPDYFNKLEDYRTQSQSKLDHTSKNLFKAIDLAMINAKKDLIDLKIKRIEAKLQIAQEEKAEAQYAIYQEFIDSSFYQTFDDSSLIRIVEIIKEIPDVNNRLKLKAFLNSFQNEHFSNLLDLTSIIQDLFPKKLSRCAVFYYISLASIERLKNKEIDHKQCYRSISNIEDIKLKDQALEKFCLTQYKAIKSSKESTNKKCVKIKQLIRYAKSISDSNIKNRTLNHLILENINYLQKKDDILDTLSIIEQITDPNKKSLRYMEIIFKAKIMSLSEEFIEDIWNKIEIFETKLFVLENNSLSFKCKRDFLLNNLEVFLEKGIDVIRLISCIIKAEDFYQDPDLISEVLNKVMNHPSALFLSFSKQEILFCIGKTMSRRESSDIKKNETNSSAPKNPEFMNIILRELIKIEAVDSNRLIELLLIVVENDIDRNVYSLETICSMTEYLINNKIQPTAIAQLLLKTGTMLKTAIKLKEFEHIKKFIEFKYSSTKNPDVDLPVIYEFATMAIEQNFLDFLSVADMLKKCSQLNYSLTLKYDEFLKEMLNSCIDENNQPLKQEYKPIIQKILNSLHDSSTISLGIKRIVDKDIRDEEPPKKKQKTSKE